MAHSFLMEYDEEKPRGVRSGNLGGLLLAT